MVTSISINQRLLVVFVVTATLLMSLAVTLRPARASVEDACTGASEVVDWGYAYLVKGTKGDDTIDCSNSDKAVILQGGWGSDTLIGSAFNDTVRGGWGDDAMYGGGGDDWLHGGHGNDWLFGGDGTDNCLGGQDWDYIDCEYPDWGQEP